MGEHGSDSPIPQLDEAVRDLRRNAVVAEFDQQIICVADNVSLGRGENVLKVLVGKMEIATQAELGRIANQAAQMLQ